MILRPLLNGNVVGKNAVVFDDSGYVTNLLLIVDLISNAEDNNVDVIPPFSLITTRSPWSFA